MDHTTIDLKINVKNIREKYMIHNPSRKNNWVIGKYITLTNQLFKVVPQVIKVVSLPKNQLFCHDMFLVIYFPFFIHFFLYFQTGSLMRTFPTHQLAATYS